MKLTLEQLKKIIAEELGEVSGLKEGYMKQIFTEFRGFVESYDLQAEDILGMMDMLWPESKDVNSVVADS